MDRHVLARVLVTGSEGQLGAALMSRLTGVTNVSGVDLGELDVTDASAVRSFVRSRRPTLIINCAAFNDVDSAETGPLAALRANGEAVWTLASLAQELEALFVHYTTEFVFDGRLERPYTEMDEPAPESVYGMSKLIGERFAANAGRHYVLRLSSVYGGHTKRTVVDWMLSQCRAGRPLTAFTDRTVSPSYVPDVVNATMALTASAAPFGTYHCGSSDWCTWADVAQAIVAATGSGLLQPVEWASAQNRATRPRNCAMSSDKLNRVGIATRPWRNALAEYLSGRPAAE